MKTKIQKSQKLKQYDNFCGFLGCIEEYDEIIEKLEDELKKREVAEEYNGGWIPCSERLPEYGEVVMCSCSNGGITISCITHNDVNQSKVVRFGSHSVVAWQPLPEPFKERD